MPSKRSLYYEKSVEGLNKLVNCGHDGLVDLFRASEILYNHSITLSKADPLDEELLYIICCRYIYIVGLIKKREKDDNFHAARYAKYLAKITAIKDQCESSLKIRYQSTSLPEVEDIPKSSPPSATSTTISLLAEEIFISPDIMYKLMMDKNVKLLIIDIRNEVDFIKTKLKYSTIINIPECHIGEGQTTHSIENQLLGETKEIFNKRKRYDLIVLIDSDTTAIIFQKTKIETMRKILIHWDNDLEDLEYKKLPVILSGGIKAWADNYPTLVTNPQIVFSLHFTKLDDLVSEIDYPEEQTSENVEMSSTNEILPHPCTVDTDIGRSQKEDESHCLRFLQELHIIAKHQLKIEMELHSIYNKILSIKKNVSKENQKPYLGKILTLSADISKNESIKIQLNERRSTIDYEYNKLKSTLSDQLISAMVGEIKEVDKQTLCVYQQRRQLENSGKYFIKQLKNYSRSNIEPNLRESRDIAGRRKNLQSIVPKIPDRSSKPKRESLFPKKGIVGLVNIKNTCYMNSLIQCLRFCSSFLSFFLDNSFICNKNNNLTYTLSELLIKLSGEDRITVRPMAFYTEICKRDKARRYIAGGHEDVQEFYLFLIKELETDNSIRFENTNGETSSKFLNWLKNHGMNLSYFTKVFYFQIEIHQVCPGCGCEVVKYDHSNTIFINFINEGQPVIIKDYVKEYLDVNDHDLTTSTFCTKCEMKYRPKKEVTYYPTILTITLLRQDYSPDMDTIKRINSLCHYQDEIFFGKCKYNLRSISCHKGDRDRGHYTSICLHPIENRWVEFNDDRFQYVDGYSNEYRIKAYMLFYELDKNYENVNDGFFP